jgi:hypothetical protein
MIRNRQFSKNKLKNYNYKVTKKKISYMNNYNNYNQKMMLKSIKR